MLRLAATVPPRPRPRTAHQLRRLRMVPPRPRTELRAATAADSQEASGAAVTPEAEDTPEAAVTPGAADTAAAVLGDMEEGATADTEMMTNQ